MVVFAKRIEASQHPHAEEVAGVVGVIVVAVAEGAAAEVAVGAAVEVAAEAAVRWGVV